MLVVVVKQLSEQELRRQAVQALSDRLGPIDALRFLALISREPFDYQEWRREYFSQYNVAERLNPSMKLRAGGLNYLNGERY
jgi:hypothetical protein